VLQSAVDSSSFGAQIVIVRAGQEVAMRHNGLWIFVGFLVSAALPGFAGDIAFLDAERAVGTVKEGQQQLQALEAWAVPERQRLEEVRSRVAELTQQLANQRTIASADVIRETENELLKAQREFEDAGRKFNRDLENKQNEFLAQVATRVGGVASEYAAANGLDAVFVLKAQPLVYVAEGADITNTVIELYDEKYPVD
jgi:Skp family chaperone for outer membrane proteins